MSLAPWEFCSVYYEHLQVGTGTEYFAKVQAGQVLPWVEPEGELRVVGSLRVEEFVEAADPVGLGRDVLEGQGGNCGGQEVEGRRRVVGFIDGDLV